jgi:cytochrome b6-f complex iron-sulfur subunit
MFEKHCYVHFAAVSELVFTNTSMTQNITRRDFLRTASQLTTGAVCVAVCGCSGGGEEANSGDSSAPLTATANADGTFTVAGGGKLQIGQALAFTMPPDNAPGVLLALQAGQVSALSAKCTHVGCTVVWQNAGNSSQGQSSASGTTEGLLVCPCHSSRFAPSGAVLGGPAKGPLPRFTVRVQGDDAIVSVSA